MIAGPKGSPTGLATHQNGIESFLHLHQVLPSVRGGSQASHLLESWKTRA